MALIKCTECQKDVSDKAKICPHCGYGLQEKEEIETPTEKTKTETPLFSTKNLYKTNYMVCVAMYGIIFIIIEIPLTILSLGVGGIIGLLVFGLIWDRLISGPKSMQQSYVDLYHDKICGMTTFVDKNNLDKKLRKGIAFTIDYQDVTHIDCVSNHVAIIRTNHGDYTVQAYNSAGKLVEMIQQQKEKLS